MNSFTEENYLKAIYKLAEHHGEAVTTNAIAEKMSTKASSVTDMLRKLSGKKLLNYQKYQGVTLTASGKRTAVNIIRKHRLWELFLVDKLQFKWDEVHEIAEQLEHIQSEELTNRIDRFLGFPKFDPHGDPIPDVNGKMVQPRSALLAEMKKNDRSTMTGVVDHSPVFLNYLDNAGIRLGDDLVIQEVIAYDRSLQVLVNKKKSLQLSAEASKNILVRKK
jgi:DtxR family Mn-dependent transcriptional regulator